MFMSPKRPPNDKMSVVNTTHAHGNKQCSGFLTGYIRGIGSEIFEAQFG